MGTPDEAVPFDRLSTANLVIDASYDGGADGTIGDDPLARLLPVGNQGGFRYAGSPRRGTVKLVVLYTTSAEPDWPDHLDPQTGLFTYYGDNRRPGRELHDTRRAGNHLLREVFERTHGNPADRREVPPFLLFEKAAPGRRITFRGLLAPGGPQKSDDEELVAIWPTSQGRRFQNYRAQFTVLDVPSVTRAWIDDILTGNATDSDHCPTPWKAWGEGRTYLPLLAPTTTVVRSKDQQLPDNHADKLLLKGIKDFFRGREHDFETCAVQRWRLIAPATGKCDVTRPSRDGGRDATGEYILGPTTDPIAIDFALEAKCYAETNSVGVRDVARLISRIRHRHFGVFITTSYFNAQVYQEVRTDRHPIVLISGRDIIQTLRTHGYGDFNAVRNWLSRL